MSRPVPRHGRRQFLRGSLALAGLGLIAGCGIIPPSAQPAPKIPRVGVLAGVSQPQHEGFRQGLRDLGYTDGESITVEYQYADGRIDRLPELATELVRRGPQVIVALGDPAIRAAREATRTIPIVMQTTSDPVAAGFVDGLGHPGGNVTGLTTLAPQLGGKRLELLKQVVPGASRVVAVWDTFSADRPSEAGELAAAARLLGLELRFAEIPRVDDLAGVFDRVAREQADALVIQSTAATLVSPSRTLGLVAATQRPAIYERRLFVEAGGLMAYGPDYSAFYQHLAAYVDKILKGARPGDIPVQQPTTFELVINLKTARALGLTIPELVLIQATAVVE
jgi:putative tryptophan/tyrosine transport system substrate-binding protein